MNYPQFQAKWLNPAGQRVDYDHEYAYQCTDLIRQYCYEVFGLGDAAGGVAYAIRYWTTTPPGMLSKFQKVQTSDVQAGDIVVINNAATGNDATSHITLATGNQNATQYEAMEQNGGSGSGDGVGTNAIRLRWIYKTRIAGVLRPIVVVVPPAVPMISLDQLTALYREILLRDPDVAGIQHYVGHFTYDFVRNDMLNSNEYKTIQANQAATAAAQAQAAAEAAAQAAQAAQQQPTAPAGAATVPTSTEKYPIVAPFLYIYGSKTDAMNRTNPKGEIYEGRTWYKYYENDGMLNITQEPGTTSGTWINPADNVVPAPQPDPEPTPDPTPEPTVPAKVETEDDIRASLQPMMPDGSPVECEVLVPVLAVDVLGYGTAITIGKNRDVKVWATFQAAGHYFALVKIKDKQRQEDYMYGINIAARDNFKPYLSDPYTMNDHLKKTWELFYDKAFKTIDGIFRVIAKKKK